MPTFAKTFNRTFVILQKDWCGAMCTKVFWTVLWQKVVIGVGKLFLLSSKTLLYIRTEEEDDRSGKYIVTYMISSTSIFSFVNEKLYLGDIFLSEIFCTHAAWLLNALIFTLTRAKVPIAHSQNVIFGVKHIGAIFLFSARYKMNLKCPTKMILNVL